jgi:hypothetical protein
MPGDARTPKHRQLRKENSRLSLSATTWTVRRLNDDLRRKRRGGPAARPAGDHLQRLGDHICCRGEVRILFVRKQLFHQVSGGERVLTRTNYLLGRVSSGPDKSVLRGGVGWKAEHNCARIRANCENHRLGNGGLPPTLGDHWRAAPKAHYRPKTCRADPM